MQSGSILPACRIVQEASLLFNILFRLPIKPSRVDSYLVRCIGISSAKEDSTGTAHFTSRSSHSCTLRRLIQLNAALVRYQLLSFFISFGCLWFHFHDACWHFIHLSVFVYAVDTSKGEATSALCALFFRSTALTSLWSEVKIRLGPYPASLHVKAHFTTWIFCHFPSLRRISTSFEVITEDWIISQCLCVIPRLRLNFIILGNWLLKTWFLDNLLYYKASI